MRLIYGTTNRGKLQHMQDMLQGLGIELVDLNGLNFRTVKIDESGNNPLDNATIKARAYYSVLKTPVFSCDSGLYFEGLKPHEQPGVHIRRVSGRELTDAEMIKHYAHLASQLGGRVKARYRNAICLVVSDNEVYKYDGDDIASKEFFIVSAPHSKVIPGFPLDSLSVACESGQYYFDLKSDQDQKQAESIQALGFRRFFERSLGDRVG